MGDEVAADVSKGRLPLGVFSSLPQTRLFEYS